MSNDRGSKKSRITEKREFPATMRSNIQFDPSRFQSSNEFFFPVLSLRTSVCSSQGSIKQMVYRAEMQIDGSRDYVGVFFRVAGAARNIQLCLCHDEIVLFLCIYGATFAPYLCIKDERNDKWRSLRGTNGRKWQKTSKSSHGSCERCCEKSR